MTTVLTFGVIDVPYSVRVPEQARRVRVRTVRGDGKDKAPRSSSAAPSGGETTGDVAEILEAQYSVMEYFFTVHETQIMEALEDGMGLTMEALSLGHPVPEDPFAEAMGKIEQMFREYLDRSEVLGLLGSGPGTAAGRAGVNHRLKHPYAKGNPSRPPFINTGLFQSSFKAWVARR